MLKNLIHWLRVLSTELGEGFLTPSFLLSLLAAVAALLLGSTAMWFPDEEALRQGLSWQYYLLVLDCGFKSEVFVFCLPLLSAFPAGISVLRELQSGYLKAYLPRCGRGPYVAGKVLLSIATGGGSVCLGYFTAAGVLGMVYRPLEQAAGKDDISVWGQRLEQALVVFLAGAFFALLSAAAGLIFENRYMAFGGGFMVSYLCIIVTSRYLTGVYVLNPREWFAPEHYWQGGYLGCAGFLMELCVLMALLYGQLLFVKIGGGKRGDL